MAARIVGILVARAAFDPLVEKSPASKTNATLGGSVSPKLSNAAYF
jgi:hypothetical protein